MLKIRLQRVGRKHEPAFRLVVTDSKNSTKSGKILEVIGNHDFRFDKKTKIDDERAKHWMKQGVQLSPTVHNLFVTHKVIEGKKINVLPRKSPPKKDEAVAPVSEAPKTEPKSGSPDVAVRTPTPSDVGAPAKEEASKIEETPKTEETKS